MMTKCPHYILIILLVTSASALHADDFDASGAFNEACSLKRNIQHFKQMLVDEHKAAILAGFTNKVTLYQVGSLVGVQEQELRNAQREYRKATGKALNLSSCEKDVEDPGSETPESLTEEICGLRQSVKQFRQVIATERGLGRRTGYVNSVTLHDAALYIVQSERQITGMTAALKKQHKHQPSSATCNSLQGDGSE